LVKIFCRYKQLLFTTFGPEVAAIYGVKTRQIDVLLALILAALLIAAMQIVGVTLIAASLGGTRPPAPAPRRCLTPIDAKA
jgi:manganese/iron transport system permease protein/iron/zinc/copper transport system permease protein